MIAYLIKKIAHSFTTLFVLATLTFFLLRIAPGGPFDSDQAWPPEIQANILKHYGLDQPLSLQFLSWINSLLHGDLRESFEYLGHPVTEIIGMSLPISLQIGSTALFFALIIGIGIGCLGAWKERSWVDRAFFIFNTISLNIPTFLIASFLILFFAIRLGWLPAALWEESGASVLPVITLGLRPLSMIASLTRASMIEALQSDFIRTAHGKGVHPRQIIFKHALRNSLIPVISLIGPLAAQMITGSFVVEAVFQIPGLGKHFVQAVMNRDYPLVMGVTLTYGVIFVSIQLVCDLLCGVADPRVRLGEPAK